MNRDLERRAFEIFDEVCDLPVSERASALDERCRDEPELRSLVEGMIREDESDRHEAHEQPGAGMRLLATELLEAVPERVGRYRIIREIGRGGMGVVYEAEQEHPKRRVALKLIRDAFASAQIQRRFRRESELLGRLQHAGIAHVYEAGSESVQGRPTPFIAMEFVEGQPLDAHVRSAQPSRRDVLQLFVRICDGVQHAHQKGVIHRDLKPGNVLIKRETSTASTGAGTASDTHVDSVGQPKIVDFGVARVSDPDSQATLQTHAGQLVGTLAYMSPEQIDGDPASIDTRCDVYAIGVMLYQMLAGRMPVDVSGKPVAEAARLIRETEPTPLGAIDSSLKGDLETIVATAMERDRDRRYASAAALGEDIRRFLASEPITARPASAAYQLAKFAARNRTLVGGALMGVVFLVAGVIAASVGLVSSLRANQALEQRNEELEAVTEFQASQLSDLDLAAMGVTLRSYMMEATPDERREDLDRALGGVNLTSASLEMLSEHVFARTERSIDEELADQPLVRARLLGALADTMRDIGLADDALPIAERAHQINMDEIGPDGASTLEMDSLLGKIHLALGNLAAAESSYADVLARASRLLGSDAPETLEVRQDQGAVLIAQERATEAETLLRDVLNKLVEQSGEDNEQAANAMTALGVALGRQGKDEEAISLYERAIEIYRRLHGDEHQLTINARWSLVTRLGTMGRHNQAADAELELLKTLERTRGNDHPDTIALTHQHAGTLEALSRFDESEAMARTAVERSREALGPFHPTTLRATNSLAYSLDGQGRFAEAETLYRQAHEGLSLTLGPDHTNTIQCAGNLGYVINQQGRAEEAEPYYRESYEALLRLHGEEHPSTLRAMSNLASLLAQMGELEEAEPLTLRSYEVRLQLLGPTHPSTLNSLYTVGNFYLKTGDLDAAEPYCEQALSGHRELDERHIGTLHSFGLLANLRKAQGRIEEAEALWLEAIERRTDVLGEDHPLTVDARAALDELRNPEDATPESE